jgi:hypothetical protein
MADTMNEPQERFFEYAAANGLAKLSKEDLQVAFDHFCAGWKASDASWMADLHTAKKNAN